MDPLMQLHHVLLEKSATVASVESCTGGLMSVALTSQPGSSKYFLGGICAYSNVLKKSMLGVSSIEKMGAVSAEVAKEMAEGGRAVLRADWVLSTTGIAGPGGGTEEKPVGLVFVGLASAHRSTEVEKYFFSGDRGQIREQSVLAALRLLLRRIG